MIGCIGTKSEGKSDVCMRDVRIKLGIPALGLALALGLSGCSSVPDSVNPVTWFESDDAVIANSAAASDQEGEKENAAEAAPTPPPQGLLADRSNAKYADTIRREVAPTKPLARRAPAPAEVQTAETPARPQAVETVTVPPAAPQAAPAPAQLTPVQPGSAQPAPATSPDARAPVDRTQPVARDLGPAQPPASVDMTPPPQANIPATIADPLRRPRLVQSQFEKRLSESAQTTVRPDVVDMSNAGGAGARGGEEAPIHLIPPSAQRKSAAARPAPQPDGPAATFQVAALDFQAGSANLTQADRTAIAEVARLYRQTGGMVRVVGIAPSYVNAGTRDVSQASIERANAVARELARRGVPATKILVGADPSPAFGEPVGARIYLDVI